MKICIYGGSFNPPHLGHTAALRAVRAAIRPDLTLVIPDRIPPHKELTAGSPEPAERLLMTMLAFSGEPGVEVSDMELHRSGKSYTADTVRELRACNPDAELYLVIGTDMLTTFEEWHDFRYLLGQVTLVALARTGDEHDEVERFSAYLRETYADPLAHAEVKAMAEAAASLDTWNLADCTLVVTLEPCPMCAGACLQTHIGRIVFGAWDAKLGACGSVWDIPRDPHVGLVPEVIGGVREAECGRLMTDFFARRR